MDVGYRCKLPVIGGSASRYAIVVTRQFMTPLRVILAIAALFLAFGYLSKAACLQTIDTGSGAERVADWRNGRAYSHYCYTDVVPLYTAQGLNQGRFPYQTGWIEKDTQGRPLLQYDGTLAVRYMEYPLVTGVYQYTSMRMAEKYTALANHVPVPAIAAVVLFFNIAAAGLALAWLVTVWATAILSGSRIWDVVMVAASPLVIVHAFTNFDALATACALTALLAWARRKPALAGVLIGIGTAAKLYPIVLLLPLVIVGFRAGKLRDVTRTAASSIGTWLLMNLAFIVLYPRGWSEFYFFNERRLEDVGSVYAVFRSMTGWSGFDQHLGYWQPPTLLNAVVASTFALLCAGIVFVGLRAPRRPRVAQLAFLVVAALLLTSKVWSPQYSLWLVPLAVLALPHRRVLLAWMTIDALTWIPLMLFLYGQGSGGIDERWYASAVVLRDVAVIALCVMVIRQIYRPDTDTARKGGVDDPGGGVFDRAPDRLPIAGAAPVPSGDHPRSGL